ncbi:MAG: sialidase family protein [Geodermatophilaceae bacterium]
MHRQRLVASISLSALAVLLAAAPVTAAPPSPISKPPLQQLSSDPYKVPVKAQYATEVEPDSFSFGSTVVTAFQVGRYIDGGAVNIGWATTTDGGALSWTNGLLPGITVAAGGPADRASDPSVAYDAAHDVWLISVLAITFGNEALVTSRSTDGGLTWQDPVPVLQGATLDKNWIVCDNTASSSFYGHCYTEFDRAGGFNRAYMATSTDGALSWAPAVKIDYAGQPIVAIGGQPIVQPDGTVIVPIVDALQPALVSFRSTDGGVSWSVPTLLADLRVSVTNALRAPPFPSVDVDASGRVYVVWSDCRFRRDCRSNDLVLSTSEDGLAWTDPVRIPLDPVTTRADHFLPGLAVQPGTSGGDAHLALTYYFYADASCSTGSCQLSVAFVDSPDGGQSWTRLRLLAGPMKLRDLAFAGGYFVGDYISTSYAGAGAFGFFAVGKPRPGPIYDEAIYTTRRPLFPSSGPLAPVESGPVVASSSERLDIPTW